MGTARGGGKAAVRLFLAAGIGLAGLIGQAGAGEKKINVQGRLADSAGVPVAGSQVVTFRLYHSSGDPVAARVWEDHLGVVFDSGTFSVALGGNASLDALPFNRPYYLGVQVAGDGEEMSPRQLLGSAAYAMGSVGDFSAGRNLYVTGNTGIGTLSAESGLHVFAGDNLATFQSSAAAGSPAVRLKNASRSWSLRGGGGFSLVDDTAGAPRLSVSSAGYVGIGTANPAARLHVSAAPGSGAALLLNNNTSLAFRDTSGNPSLQIYAGTDNRLHTNATLHVGAGGVIVNNNQALSFLGTSGNIAAQIYAGTDNILHSNNSIKFDQVGGPAIRLNYTTGIEFRGASGGIMNLFGWTDHIRTDGSMHVGGWFSAVSKNFVIPHPMDPSKTLTHSVLEGPEQAVYYRGEGKIQDGRAVIRLPAYFESLTRPEGRTVQLTCVGGYSPLYVSSPPANGQFEVRTVSAGGPGQAFYWEVKAVRADLDPLVVEKTEDSKTMEKHRHSYERVRSKRFSPSYRLEP